MVALANISTISNWRNFPAWRDGQGWGVKLLGDHECRVSPIGGFAILPDGHGQRYFNRWCADFTLLGLEDIVGWMIIGWSWELSDIDWLLYITHAGYMGQSENSWIRLDVCIEITDGQLTSVNKREAMACPASCALSLRPLNHSLWL